MHLQLPSSTPTISLRNYGTEGSGQRSPSGTRGWRDQGAALSPGCYRGMYRY